MNYALRFLCLLTVCGRSLAISKHPIIIIVAFDGFRYDYMDRGLTPTLERLKKTGASTEFMYNVFPTVTSPNFFSIATGLYPETHGVLGNHAFNEKLKCLGAPGDDELFRYNEDIVPLWTLNEMSGDGRHSGTMLWPSSEYTYQNTNVTFRETNSSMDFVTRVNTTINWILDEETPANLVFLYFGEPDWVAHENGPDSEQTDMQLMYLNGITDYLLYKLRQHKLHHRVNLIFLSDHGMITLPKENQIDFRQFLDANVYAACGESPVWYISAKFVNEGYEDEMYKNLTEASRDLKGAFAVYRRDEVPERWHIKNCRRMSDLAVVAKMPQSFDDDTFVGSHGYDNAEPKMRPFFLANGPLFKSNYVVQPFENIDIYPLVMDILRLKSPPGHVQPNGTLAIIKNMLLN